MLGANEQETLGCKLAETITPLGDFFPEKSNKHIYKCLPVQSMSFRRRAVKSDLPPELQSEEPGECGMEVDAREMGLLKDPRFTLHPGRIRRSHGQQAEGERLEELDNATTDVLDFMWIDELHTVVTLPNPVQRHQNTTRGCILTCSTVLEASCERRQTQALQNQEDPLEKAAAGAFAQHFVADLVDSVWNSLCERDYSSDPVKRGS